MIKVCQVVSDTNIGGAGRYLLNYLKYFDRDKFNVSVVIPKNSRLLEFISAYKDVKVYEMPYMADKSYDNRCVAALKKLFFKERFDIVHTHASLSARVAAKTTCARAVIATRHCIEPVGKGMVFKLKTLLNNLLCDYYVAVSNSVSDNLSDTGIKKKKIKTVYNGVEPIYEVSDDEKNDIKSKYKIGDEPVFGIFARLEEIKGHRYFIEAAKEYLKDGKKGKFLIVGDGSLKDKLKELSESFPQIIFTGYKEDTTELLNITDVNVISSASEAMSLAILEAMSLGKPTIATNVGGNPQLIRNFENGILVEYKDVSALKEAFCKMADDKEFYSKCSKNAKRDFNENFTAEIMIKNIQNLYQEVYDERK